MTLDLTTQYLGLKLSHPLIAAASPLTSTVEGMRRLEDAGAAAAVMASLYEETSPTAASRAGASPAGQKSEIPGEVSSYRTGIAGYLDTLSRAAEALEIPVIASINCTTPEGWCAYAREVEQAGAAAIELNFFATPRLGRSSADTETELVETVAAVRQSVRVPLAAKITSHFSAIDDIATRLVKAGADGLVLFNTSHEPDIDLDKLAITYPANLGNIANVRTSLLWIGLLSPRIKCSFAGSGGVATHNEVVKYLLAGADAVMTASALLQHGTEYLRQLVVGLSDWLEYRRYDSVRAIQGLRDASHFEGAEELLRTRHIAALRQYASSETVL